MAGRVDIPSNKNKAMTAATSPTNLTLETGS